MLGLSTPALTHRRPVELRESLGDLAVSGSHLYLGGASPWIAPPSPKAATFDVNSQS